MTVSESARRVILCVTSGSQNADASTWILSSTLNTTPSALKSETALQSTSRPALSASVPICAPSTASNGLAC